MHATFVARFEVHGVRRGPGTPPDGEDHIALSIATKDVAEGERVFKALAQGGTIEMPFDKAFWGGSSDSSSISSAFSGWSGARMTTLVHPATPTEIEQSLIELREGAKRWVALRTAAKAELLIAVRQSVYDQAPRWAQAAIEAKGLAGSPLAGEEWVSGPWALLYALNRYIRTMHDLAREGAPRIDASRVHERADGQVTVDVFPNAFYDRLLLSGVRAQVWMQPGVTRENLKSTMAVWYRHRRRNRVSRWCSGRATSRRSRRLTCSTSSSPMAPSASSR